MFISKKAYTSTFGIQKAMAVAAVTVGALFLTQPAWAAAGDRSGKQVVETVCVVCHGSGEQGAPKIGDAQAWSPRASQGLTMLTKRAINGIRQMPAHGGNPGLNDLEIKRAITYMVNLSGGSWTEPIDKGGSYIERTGEQVVQTQCAKCHETGKDGAPKIGDQGAWAQRLKHGLDTVVRSAINGHGGMPPRGGMVDLTDAELRNAVLYMFSPVGAPTEQSEAVSTTATSARHAVIGDMAIYLGIAPTTSIRGPERLMHGGVPGGGGYYHLNVSLMDNKTKGQIKDAQVEVTVGGRTKKFELMTTNEWISYGNYIQMVGGHTYPITVHVERPSMSQKVSVDFNIKP